MKAEQARIAQAKQLLSTYQQRCEQKLASFLPEQPYANPLYKAMRYTLLAPSKRLRPAIIYATAQAFGGNLEQTDHAACAMETMHTFSLIHDDLPAMDDDELRRGLPSSHCVFGEDIAILAGDALLSYSFELLCKQPIADHLTRQSMQILAQYSGGEGMALGQALDCILTKQQANKKDIIEMQYLKTGALFQASFMMGALSAGMDEPDVLHTLSDIGKELGLAFQLKDDLLDLISTTEELGKPIMSDADLNKPSYALRFGLATTENLIHSIFTDVVTKIQSLPCEQKNILLLADLIIHRNK